MKLSISKQVILEMRELVIYGLMISPIGLATALYFYGYSNVFFFFFKYLKPLSHKRRKIIEKFAYYRNLPFHKKNEFERRVQRFISLKEFIPKDMEEVTQEMQVMIASSAVQLTFGLKEVQLASFSKIYVFPSKYYSRINKRYHKGEVNTKGHIVISWDNFTQGYENPSDGHNLGLHEMAHALLLQYRMSNYEQHIFDDESYKNWQKQVTEEYKFIDRGHRPYLRPYAFRDKEEFFPVSVEFFFEKPKDFQYERPELYDAMVKLLKQDPARNAKE